MKKRKKHTPEQIVAKLRDADVMLNSGKDVAAFLQSLEICEATYQRWRAQYGGMKSDEAKRLSSTQKRETVQRIRNEFEVSERRACLGLGFRRSALRYKRRLQADEPQLRKQILELVRKRPRSGYRRIAQLQRSEGFRASNKRVHRIWRQEGRKVPKKTRKKRALGERIQRMPVVIGRRTRIMFGVGISSLIVQRANKH